jgi:DNA-binding MarR family transcriptional regulator
MSLTVANTTAMLAMYSFAVRGASPSPVPGLLIWRLSTRWRTAVDRGLAPLGLTHAQYTVLASLRGLTRAGRCTSQRQLADETGMDQIYVSKLSRALERAGLVVRTANPTDSRAVQLALTRRGDDVADEAAALVRDLLEQLTAPLGGLRGARTRALSDALELMLAGPVPTPNRRRP